MNKERIVQYICFAILMGFLAFALTVNAAECGPTNAQDLLKLGNAMKPAKPTTLVKR